MSSAAARHKDQQRLVLHARSRRHQRSSPRMRMRPLHRCRQICRSPCIAAGPRERQPVARRALQHAAWPPCAAAAPAQSPACAASGWAGGGRWPARARPAGWPPWLVVARRWRRRQPRSAAALRLKGRAAADWALDQSSARQFCIGQGPGRPGKAPTARGQTGGAAGSGRPFWHGLN